MFRLPVKEHCLGRAQWQTHTREEHITIIIALKQVIFTFFCIANQARFQLIHNYSQTHNHHNSATYPITHSNPQNSQRWQTPTSRSPNRCSISISRKIWRSSSGPAILWSAVLRLRWRGVACRTSAGNYARKSRKILGSLVKHLDELSDVVVSVRGADGEIVWHDLYLSHAFEEKIVRCIFTAEEYRKIMDELKGSGPKSTDWTSMQDRLEKVEVSLSLGQFMFEDYKTHLQREQAEHEQSENREESVRSGCNIRLQVLKSINGGFSLPRPEGRKWLYEMSEAQEHQ